MKAAQFQRLSERYLVPALPGFTAKGALVYASPLDHLIRGFYFERSGIDPSSFYVWSFIQPLYVPSRHIYFTFGKRLENGWTLDSSVAKSSVAKNGQANGQHAPIGGEAAVMASVVRAIEAEGLPVIANAEISADLANRIESITDAPDDPYVIEVILYSLLLAGEYARTQEEYARLKRILSALDQGLAWPREIAQRAAQVMDKLATHPDDAVALLDAWARQTARDLHLPEPQLTHRQFARAV